MHARLAVLLVVAAVVAACSHSKTQPRASPSLRQLDRPGSFAVILDAPSLRPLTAVRFNNPIRAAVADDHGGWFVGGSFIRANGKLRKRLAHIRADGTLDPHWHPEANGNGVSVTGLALAARRLYVSGDFAYLNDKSRIHLGAVDATTGRLEAWNETSEASGVGFGVVDVYGGRAIVGAPGFQLRAVPAGGAQRWTIPIGTRLEGGGVRDFAVVRKRLYVEGVFESVDGVRRRGLAVLDTQTGRVDRRWRPRLARVPYCPACTGIEAVTATPRRVYLSVAKQLPPRAPAFVPRLYSQLIAVDTRTGATERSWRTATAETPPYGVTVATLSASDGRVYVGGSFRALGGRERHGFAVLDQRTARVLRSWNPAANSSTVDVVSRSGDRLLLGVDLSSVAASIDRYPYGREISRSARTVGAAVSLSAPGRVTVEVGRIPAGRTCTTDARCPGPTLRRRTVSYPSMGTRRIALSLASLPLGRYFVRFTVRGRGGPPQRPLAYPFRLTP